MKRILDRIFVDGLSGMAQGLFATLIIGTIIQQIGTYTGGEIGNVIYMVGKVAAGLTGAGIGAGVARKLDAGHLVVVSAAVTGMIGAFAGNMMSGQLFVDGNLVLSGPGEPLGGICRGVSCGRGGQSDLRENEAGYHPHASYMHRRGRRSRDRRRTADFQIYGMARIID